MTANTYLATANGLGGAGGTGTSGSGNGGSAQSGSSQVTVDGTAAFGGASVNGFVATAFAQGGDGQNGGSATAGSSTITIERVTHRHRVLAGLGVGLIAGNGVDFGRRCAGRKRLDPGQRQPPDSEPERRHQRSRRCRIDRHRRRRHFRRSDPTKLWNADRDRRRPHRSYGEGGDGGNGGGQGTGYSAAAPLSGTAQLTGTVTIISTGTGGDGGSGTGGDGFGGYARMSGFQGRTVTANNVTIDFERHWRQRRRRWQWLRKHQRQLGRLGIQVLDAGSSVKLQGRPSLFSNGVGGAGTTGAGGNGTAGSTFLTAVGAPLTTDAVFLSSDALGGAGAFVERNRHGRFGGSRQRE